MPQMAEMLAGELAIDAKRIDQWTRVNPMGVLDRSAS
jgi:hypothetical protein